ncbi:MAG: DUF1501 domain-containing protein [Planctomycetota bacterium]
MTLLTRRTWMQATACSLPALSFSGWLRAMAAETVGRPATAKSVILLWLNGGPSTIDLWDLKPGHAHGGPFSVISTAVPGLSLSEHLPRTAVHAGKLAVLRSMSTREGDHSRATHLVRTGYLPQAAIRFPPMGSLVAHALQGESPDLPGYVTIGPARSIIRHSSGFLGPHVSPFAIGEGERDSSLTVPHLQQFSSVDEAMQKDRLQLVSVFNTEFRKLHAAPVVENLEASLDGAIRLMRPQAQAAFALGQETDALRDAYGRTQFGQGCLLARRLVERDVPFVEVTLDGWDTHNNNFAEVARLSAILDAGLGTLLTDLQERGRLESTLVLCLGEFGRTPRINTNQGRDHWPQNWAAVVAGGGIRGGQVIGRTSADGTSIEDRPVPIVDLMATVCASLGLDPRKQNMSNVGRPIRLADPSAQVIQELL